ncbi:DNA-processing protein DprA [Sphingobacterium sp. SYP-B4668]|uniref:DNA-processing protein DprA n=1 Tax=Sphingobacterium sp. SYP-B4668 TaxID=2996035 RepID=UPI0022DD537E|nr:DNA-processing protein DprA [Sphingobacterium sp. SYP-B4668]
MSILQKIALTKIKGIGPKLSRSLLSQLGAVDAIFEASKKTLQHIPGVGEVLANEILSKQALLDAEKELAFIEKHRIAPLWWEDPNYPKRLANCEDAPLIVYYKGSVSLNPPKVISVVGTRKATAYGRKMTENLIRDLQHLDAHIISGLAYGIDVHAHTIALKHQIPTIGVLGHGLDRIYPAAHRDIASDMIDCGGLITEFPSGTNPDRQNFPMRNRIIAGMADVTIVIEAAASGGALITAEIANSYNRDVCAVPGATDQEFSAGCNYLIKTNRAHLIRHAEDLCYLMNWEPDRPKVTNTQFTLRLPKLTKDQQKVFQYIQEREQATVDEIALYCDWPQSKLAILLLEMEMEDLLISLPGKTYKLQQ